MLSRISSEFQDGKGNRLSVRLERHTSIYRVYAHHSRDGNGCSSEHSQERLARNAFRSLETKVVAEGWKLKECVALDRQPSPMLLDDDGHRMFRDYFTGEYRLDDSAFRPSPGAIFFTVKDGPQSDAFVYVFPPKDMISKQEPATTYDSGPHTVADAVSPKCDGMNATIERL